MVRHSSGSLENSWDNRTKMHREQRADDCSPRSGMLPVQSTGANRKASVDRDGPSRIFRARNRCQRDGQVRLCQHPGPGDQRQDCVKGDRAVGEEDKGITWKSLGRPGGPPRTWLIVKKWGLLAGNISLFDESRKDASRVSRSWSRQERKDQMGQEETSNLWQLAVLIIGLVIVIAMSCWAGNC